MKKIPLEMKALEHSQHLSHCNSMGIFSNAQGQLTPQSMVESCRILNSSENSWLSVLHKRIKKVGARVFTTLNSNFPNAQGHATPQSIVEFC